MEIDLIFRIAGVGLIVAVVHTILKQAGKEDYALVATLTGTVIVFVILVQRIARLFDEVRTVFRLW